jgi:hypothetical protein
MARRHSDTAGMDFAFGQMGSILITGTTATTSNGVTGMHNKIFMAITFLEDTVFANTLAGLTPESAQLYIGGGPGDGTDSKSTDIDADGGSVTGTETFPKGVTIYGRWTSITLASGKVIAYVGE